MWCAPLTVDQPPSMALKVRFFPTALGCSVNRLSTSGCDPERFRSSRNNPIMKHSILRMCLSSLLGIVLGTLISFTVLATTPIITHTQVFLEIIFPGDVEGPFRINPQDLDVALPQDGKIKFTYNGKKLAYTGKIFEIRRVIIQGEQ